MAIGYACITIGVPGTELSRCILKNASEETLRRIIKDNLSALERIIDYNSKNHINLFRISSDMIPFASHPINQICWWEEEKEQLNRIGQRMKEAGIRVSMHPGQYTVLNSPNEKVVENAIKELIYHDQFLSGLGMDRTSKMVLHIGGVYGDKAMAMNTFIKNYNKLPVNLKERIILENDDKNFTIEEVFSIYEQIGAPIVFDNLHHKINPPLMRLQEQKWIGKCGETWSKSDGKQKLHYSQQKEMAADGTHSDTIGISSFMEFYRGLANKEIDIMLEVKDKNLSAVKCIHTTRKGTKEILQAEWERYRYLVLSRSKELYQEILELINGNEDISIQNFYEKVEQALQQPEDKALEENAAKQIWYNLGYGYTKAELSRYERLINAYLNGTGTIKSVKNHLLKCAQKGNLDELISSLYFYL